MENKTKIGIGVVVLAGVGYYFYNKSKSPMTSVTTAIVEEPKKTGFDREKASKEFTAFASPIINKKISDQPSKESFVVVGGTLGGKDTIVRTAQKQPITELLIYRQMLAMLNGIPDDSDAEFTLNQFKKIYEAGDEKNYKPDLDTQIRLEKIQLKYPNALKQMDLG
jgi:hypothetical protein